MRQKVLELVGVSCGYGDQRVLDGVSVSVEKGDVILLVGPNGSGKSTLLRCVFGLLPVWRGTVSVYGRGLVRHVPSELLKVGIIYLSQGGNIFPHLTVRQNLEMGLLARRDGFASGSEVELLLARYRDLFPDVVDRLDVRGLELSGGEQQLVALLRAFIASPRILLLDEPTLNLASAAVEKLFDALRRELIEGLDALVLVEHRLELALEIATSVVAIDRGAVVFRGSPTGFRGLVDRGH